MNLETIEALIKAHKYITVEWGQEPEIQADYKAIMLSWEDNAQMMHELEVSSTGLADGDWCCLMSELPLGKLSDPKWKVWYNGSDIDEALEALYELRADA